MSNIAIHDLSARARGRIGRIAQIDALPPQLDRHGGNHWQLNRASVLVPRAPRTTTPEPWDAYSAQSLTIAVRGASSSTTTTSRRVGFPFVIRDVLWTYAIANLGEVSADITISGEGSVYHVAAETPILTHPTTSTAVGTNSHKQDIRRIVPYPGASVTLSCTNLSGTSDIFLSVTIQPLSTYLDAVARGMP